MSGQGRRDSDGASRNSYESGDGPSTRHDSGDRSSSERTATTRAGDPDLPGRHVSRRDVLGASVAAGLGLAGVSASPTVSADDHEADVWSDGGTWHAAVYGASVYSGSDLFGAVQAAIDELDGGRTQKETVVVHDGGSASGTVSLPSYTAVDFREPIEHHGDDVPFYADQEEAIEITSLTIDTTAGMGMRFQRCTDVVLGTIEITGGPGLGVRIDGGRSMGLEVTEHVRIDEVYVEETGSHGVETYNVHDVEIGTVEARDTGGCGLLLNATSSADVGLVDAVRADEGGGYAGFRCANDAGPDIHVEEVRSVDCGRGVFTVSGSHGITIDRVHLEGNGGNLIENTQDLTIDCGLVENDGGEGFRVHGRSDTSHHPTQNVTIRNCGIYGHDYGIRETGPGTGDNAFVGNDLCDNGTDVETQSSETVVEDNTFCEEPPACADPCEDAEPTPIDPYLRVDDGDGWSEWENTDEVTIESGTMVEFGPHPTEASGWSWDGPGVSATTREVVVEPEDDATYTATYTDDCEETSSQQFTVLVDDEGGGNPCEEAGAADGEQLENGDWVCDLNGDGSYRDVNADGDVTSQDLGEFFANQHRDPWDSRDDLFDYNDDGTVGQPDVVDLFEQL